MVNKGFLFDGVAASQAIDSSGEILDIDGCDVSDWENGLGTLNFEHRGEDSPGASALDTVGRIVSVKKIFKLEDCENDRQKEYFKQIKELPYIYIVGRLADGAGHAGAQALAALMRDHAANDGKILVRLSIEGSTLEKEGNRLKRSVAKRCAMTLRPCNKTCDVGILQDPNAPSGFSKNPEEAKKDILADLATKKSEHQEHPHPAYMRLGGSVELECQPLLKEEVFEMALKKIIRAKVLAKAIEAGNYNAAPSALVGGAALQRGDIDQRVHLINKAKAALRDYGHRITNFNKAEFKEFVKHRLPEADPAFIERFANLVEDYRVRKNLAKKEAKVALTKKPKQTVLPGMEPPPPDERLTIRGTPVEPNPKLKIRNGIKFDEKLGVLHTPRGSFPIHIPGRPDSGSTPEKAAQELEQFNSILASPHVSEHHDQAMDNWTRVNEHLKKGTMPDEMVMHAALFSMLSPNTPVKVQELMYGHLVDQMKQTGLDPRKPGAMEHHVVPNPNDPKRRIRVPGTGGPLGEAWLGSSHPQQLPEHSRGYFENLGDALRLKADSDPTRVGSGRSKGDVMAFMLANDKLRNMAQYHKLHDHLVDLVRRHGPDARAGVAELMENKKQEALWDAKRKRWQAKGTDPGEFGGVAVPGLAPKTSRYMYGMLGAGNVHVPDTHFVRNLFGLDIKKAGGDQGSIEYLKNLLWNENNTRVLDAIDRHYAQHHPAVKHMLAHPQHGKMFSNPEEAIFPSFWKHWLAIAPYERTRGMPSTDAQNESTSHEPFWATARGLLKHDIDYNLPFETARQHRKWADQYGEMPALFLYYEQLAPKLMSAAAERTPGATIRKMEALTIELRAVMESLKKGDAQALTAGDPPYPEAKPMASGPSLLGWMDHGKKAAAATAVDSVKHGIHLHLPEQHALVHGLVPKLTRPLKPNQKGSTAQFYPGQTGWVTTPRGTLGYLKPSNPGAGAVDDEWPTTQREVAYHNLAHSVFGLGHFVPTTAAFKHPDTGEEYSVQEQVPEGEHIALDDLQPEHSKILQDLKTTGDLDKLAMMNIVMANPDRHGGNYMFSPHSPGLHLIDHGVTFHPEAGRMYHITPGYMEDHVMAAVGDKLRGFQMREALDKMPVHPEAVQWARKLDPAHLERELVRHNAPPKVVADVMDRINRLQTHLKRANTAGEGLTYRQMELAALGKVDKRVFPWPF